MSYYLLQINNYRVDGKNPQILRFWVNEEDVDGVKDLLRPLYKCLGKRRRRRSKKFHQYRQYLDTTKGNVFFHGKWLEPFHGMPYHQLSYTKVPHELATLLY